MPNFVTYASGGAPIRAERFTPAPGAARGGTVVIAHGSDGVTDHLSGPWATTMRDISQALAKSGFSVLLPYYFEKTGTDPGVPAMQSMFGHMAAWQTALADAVIFTGSARVALVGFSLGGHLSLKLRGVVPVVVEFFAPLLNGLGPAPAPRARVQIHHGEDDGLVDVANADQIARLLTEEGAAPDLHRYEKAGHGFGGAKPGDIKALKLAKQRTLDFVSANL